MRVESTVIHPPTKHIITNVLAAITPVWSAWVVQPSTDAQIVDENINQAFTQAGTLAVGANYVTYDTGELRRYIIDVLKAGSSAVQGVIQISTDNTNWYSLTNTIDSTQSNSIGLAKFRYVRVRFSTGGGGETVTKLKIFCYKF